MGVTGRICDEIGAPDSELVEQIAAIWMQSEVRVAASTTLLTNPLLVMAHCHHRLVACGTHRVEPIDLLRVEPTGGLARNRCVKQCDRQPVDLDHRVTGVVLLVVVAVVIAAHDVQSFAKWLAVARFERRPFLGTPID